MKNLCARIFCAALMFASASELSAAEKGEAAKPATVGVYYFDGWSGKTRHAKDPNAAWAKNAPTHLTESLATDFAGREPVWGWRDDSLEIMERQIDLAADNGVKFFLFCWYWSDNKKPLNLEKVADDPKHTCFDLYLKAKNKNRIKFAILVCNHKGAEIVGAENWEKTGQYLSKYFKDPQYLTVNGNPLLVIFGSKDASDADLAKVQEGAKVEGLKNGLTIAGCGKGAEGKGGFAVKTHYNVVPGYAAGSQPRRYADLIEATKQQWGGTETQPYIPVIEAGWDKRPWEGERGMKQKEGYYFLNSNPALFRSFLEDAIGWIDANPTKATKERIVLIYAWNELGEGGYLVPTKDDPNAAKLKMIKEVVEGSVVK